MTIETEPVTPRRVAFLLDNLNGGGAERVVLGVASGLSDLGYEVDLLVCELRGSLCGSIPDGVNLVVLAPSGRLAGLWAALSSTWRCVGKILSYVAAARKIPRSFRFICAISEHLKTRHPAVLLSVLPKANVNAALAVALSGVDTRIFVGIQNAVSIRSEQSRTSNKGQMHSMMPLLRYCFSNAHGIIAASRGVAEDATGFLGLDPAGVHVVYNPVAAAEPAGDLDGQLHPWFRPGAPPVILGIGRMVKQKNFPLLIRAFAAVRRRADVRLVILGGDKASDDQMSHQQELQALARELGVSDDMALLGYQSNPHAFLRAARVFVLSSDFEGFGNVVVEALLAGCPVVSTNCPSGPAEILDGGQYGILVPVNNVDGMAEAILTCLATDPEPDRLRQRGQEFSLERAVAGYQQIFFSGPPA